MTTDTAQFTFTRSFAAPQERLWHLLTDPTARAAWSGPSDDDVLVLDRSDLRVGGEDLHRCGPLEAPEYTVATRWYRLDAPQSACFTETVDAGGMRIATSLVTCDLTPDTLQDGAPGTWLSLSVTTASFVGPEALADFKAGWTTALDRLPRMFDPAP